MSQQRALLLLRRGYHHKENRDQSGTCSSIDRLETNLELLKIDGADLANKVKMLENESIVVFLSYFGILLIRQSLVKFHQVMMH